MSYSGACIYWAITCRVKGSQGYKHIGGEEWFTCNRCAVGKGLKRRLKRLKRAEVIFCDIPVKNVNSIGLNNPT